MTLALFPNGCRKDEVHFWCVCVCVCARITKWHKKEILGQSSLKQQATTALQVCVCVCGLVREGVAEKLYYLMLRFQMQAISKNGKALKNGYETGHFDVHEWLGTQRFVAWNTFWKAQN